MLIVFEDVLLFMLTLEYKVRAIYYPKSLFAVGLSAALLLIWPLLWGPTRLGISDNVDLPRTRQHKKN